MNEYERRVLDLAQNHENLKEAAASEGRLSLIEYYAYSISFGTAAAPLVAPATVQGIIPIQSDSYFVLSYINASMQFSGTPFVDKPQLFRLQITDTGAGRTLYSNPSIAELLVGGANAFIPGVPLLLTVPRVIRPNTNIKVDVETFSNNLDGIFISLIGAKVYTI